MEDPPDGIVLFRGIHDGDVGLVFETNIVIRLARLDGGFIMNDGISLCLALSPIGEAVGGRVANPGLAEGGPGKKCQCSEEDDFHGGKINKYMAPAVKGGRARTGARLDQMACSPGLRAAIKALTSAITRSFLTFVPGHLCVVFGSSR